MARLLMLVVFLGLYVVNAQNPQPLRQHTLLVVCESKNLSLQCGQIYNSLVPWWGQRKIEERNPRLKLRVRIREVFGQVRINSEVAEGTATVETKELLLDFEVVTILPTIIGNKDEAGISRIIQKLKKAVAERNQTAPQQTPTATSLRKALWEPDPAAQWRQIKTKLLRHPHDRKPKPEQVETERLFKAKLDKLVVSLKTDNDLVVYITPEFGGFGGDKFVLHVPELHVWYDVPLTGRALDAAVKEAFEYVQDMVKLSQKLNKTNRRARAQPAAPRDTFHGVRGAQHFYQKFLLFHFHHCSTIHNFPQYLILSTETHMCLG